MWLYNPTYLRFTHSQKIAYPAATYNFSTHPPPLKTVKIFYFLPKMLGSIHLDNNFQFNRLIAAVINENSDWPNYLHCEMLNLNDLTYHPLVEKLPFGSFISKDLFFSFRILSCSTFSTYCIKHCFNRSASPLDALIVES